jgi:sodium/bile acid cotransporter 7
MEAVSRLRIDPYILAILCTVGIAALIPARGSGATVASHATTFAVGLLFFLYGARLSPQAALAGAKDWRLHGVVFASTFVLFPLLGLAMELLRPTVLTPQLYTGVLFLCLLPSTVQSSIAFTSIAKGDVAAAICSASFSNLAGIIITPLLAAGLIHGAGSAGFSGKSVVDIVLQLLVPFLLGQLSRPWLADWVVKRKKILGFVDKGSILLVVYTAFSEGVVAGIWHKLSVGRLFILIGVCIVLLAVVLVCTSTAARVLGFGRDQRITIIFCGSKKSLASGLPMATVLFASGNVGLVVLPLMLFHQVQLMTCAALARRWARTAEPEKVNA